MSDERRARTGCGAGRRARGPADDPRAIRPDTPRPEPAQPRCGRGCAPRAAGAVVGGIIPGPFRR